MKLRWLLALILFLPAGLPAQEIPRDSVQTEAVRARGFIRAAETQMTKFLDLFARFAGDTSVVIVQDTLPPVQDTLPPVQDTVEVCPADWTCILPDDPATPDTTAPLPPDSVWLGGYVWPDYDRPVESGLFIQWSASAVGDSFLVVAGAKDGSHVDELVVDGETRRARINLTPYYWDLHADSVFSHRIALFTCVYGFETDVRSQEGTCDGTDDFGIMTRTEGYQVTVSGADLPIATGDEVLFVLDRPAWSDEAARPDSVVFETNGELHTDRVYPHDFPGASDPWVVPAIDTVLVQWTAFYGPGSHGGGAVFEVSSQ